MLLGDYLTAPVADVAVLSLEDVLYEAPWEPADWRALGTMAWDMAFVTATHPDAYAALFLIRTGEDGEFASGVVWGSQHAPRAIRVRPGDAVNLFRKRLADAPGWTVEAAVVR